ncbi:MAG TPA: DUF1648 domain-containing protein [Planctomycetota bacterium]|nr:DUF1648 domain-containing protein [Planctomycetota bacterium]
MRLVHAVGTVLIVGTVALGAAELLQARSELPSRVASHFGADGHADGWMSRDAFVSVSIGVLAFLGALFLGLAYGIPLLPISLINIPHREYWLATERRRATLDAVTKMLLAMGVVTTALLCGVFKLTIDANLETEPRLDGTEWSLLAGFAVVFVAILGATLWRFRKPA